MTIPRKAGLAREGECRAMEVPMREREKKKKREPTLKAFAMRTSPDDDAGPGIDQKGRVLLHY